MARIVHLALFVALFAAAGQKPQRTRELDPLLRLQDGEKALSSLSALREAGDIDADGFADVIVGSPGEGRGATAAGVVRVYSGKDGDVLLELRGSETGIGFGFSASGAGDVDGDGFSDLIVGAPEDPEGEGDQTGSAWIYSGKGELLRTLRGEVAGARFGHSVSAAGDVDMDGLADVIVGAPFDGTAGPKAGRAFVYAGKNGELLHTFEGRLAGDLFGWSVSDAGDVDGDSFEDVIVGAPQRDVLGDGYARVFSGQKGELLRELKGSRELVSFGFSVRSAGDVDADGKADLIVGAPDAHHKQGRALVFSGHDGERLFELRLPEGPAFPPEDPAAFGHSVSGAGDVDLDSFADLVVGAPRASRAEGRPGAAFVFSGKRGELLGVLWGPSDGASFGFAVTGAGDVNSDSYADVAVASRAGESEGKLEARVLVYSGSKIARP